MEKKEGFVLLTNRIHPTRENTVYLERRKELNREWLDARYYARSPHIYFCLRWTVFVFTASRKFSINSRAASGTYPSFTVRKDRNQKGSYASGI